MKLNKFAEYDISQYGIKNYEALKIAENFYVIKNIHNRVKVNGKLINDKYIVINDSDVIEFPSETEVVIQRYYLGSTELTITQYIELRSDGFPVTIENDISTEYTYGLSNYYKSSITYNATLASEYFRPTFNNGTELLLSGVFDCEKFIKTLNIDIRSILLHDKVKLSYKGFDFLEIPFDEKVPTMNVKKTEEYYTSLVNNKLNGIETVLSKYTLGDIAHVLSPLISLNKLFLLLGEKV